MQAVHGRPLLEAGHDGEVAINESLARALFGDADPIGRQFAMSPKAPMLTIVGVMKDARQISPRDRGVGVAYLPIQRYGRVDARRSSRQSLIGAGRLGTAAGADDSRRRPGRADDDDLAGARRSIARERLTSGIALFLAVLVVAIGCVGIYALMTYDVTRRRREFGVRLALGATAGRIARDRARATARRSSLRRSRSGFQRGLSPAVYWLRSSMVSMPAIPGRSLRSRFCCPSWPWARRLGLRGLRRASIR